MLFRSFHSAVLFVLETLLLLLLLLNGQSLSVKRQPVV
jgi:hypothetical protein